jgi:hypothetical protein
MKRALLVLAPVLILAGCIVRVGPPVAYRPAPAEVAYYGQHFIPESEGGGWCYLDGPHTHVYVPDHEDWYEQDGGYWYYRGPLQFTYYAGHPMPGGGWCFITGPHFHDYYPPRSTEWAWRRGQGYVYQGPYRPERPPPVHYWPRPLPLPPRARARPEVEFRPADRPQAPEHQDRAFPRPEPRPPMSDERGAPSPGHAQPGHAPPAQVAPPIGHLAPAPATSGRERALDRERAKEKEKDAEKARKEGNQKPGRPGASDHD